MVSAITSSLHSIISTDPVSCIQNLVNKVSNVVFSRWSLILCSAILSAALLNIYAGLVVGLIGCVAAYYSPNNIGKENYREYNRGVFQETLQCIEEGQRISTDQHLQMLRSIEVVDENIRAEDPAPYYEEREIIIEPLTSFDMLQRLSQRGFRPYVLDMANLYTRGGGVLHGANAQEETLCRQSDLYKGLERVEYPIPILGGVLVRGVQFFRDNEYNFVDPIVADVFVSAAYNCNVQHGGGYDRPVDPNDYRQGMETKIRSQLRAAIHNRSSAIVLSAFGCGAFMNDPRTVANMYHQILNEPEFRNAFQIVAFGIYDPPWAARANCPIFQEVFAAG